MLQRTSSKPLLIALLLLAGFTDLWLFNSAAYNLWLSVHPVHHDPQYLTPFYWYIAAALVVFGLAVTLLILILRMRRAR